MSECVGVVGLWHLGCTITAAWVQLGREVRAIDFDAALVSQLRQGQPPIFEPRLGETISAGLESGTLRIDDDAKSLAECHVVFIGYDTPVDDNDESDLSPIIEAIDKIGPHLPRNAIVVISSQLPVGSSRELRDRLRSLNATAELVYSPENLRLGEAINCYLAPGHIVIGGEARAATDAVRDLFAPMNAHCYVMNLPSAELVKHCINSFLAVSVTLANQWSDVAAATGADFGEIIPVLRADPRIGERSYITPGIGFSGGTLGRDLRVLDGVNKRQLGGGAPLFGQVWRYNSERAAAIADSIGAVVGAAGRVALLGMTYKPGTSTLRRSLPLLIAEKLVTAGVHVAVHDPKADWSEVAELPRISVASSAANAARDADLLVILTEWPEYRELDFPVIARGMRHPRLLDPKGFLRPCLSRLAAAGITLVPLLQPLARATR